ncbi:MAG: carboxypeptidase regulatory-like domain-containing protein [Myxococcales bacterium]|nr:carboxypeptidase regulatory-like domain-containing protein [Myxococcales bacterium]
MNSPRASSTSSQRSLLVAGIVLIAGAAIWGFFRRSDDAADDVAEAARPASLGARGGLEGAEGGENDPRIRGALGLPRGAILGSVRDVDGAPIAGAEVCGRASSMLLPSADATRPRCTTSGPDGRYRLDDLPPVSYRISASAPRFIAGRFRLPGPDTLVQPPAGGERRGVDIVLEGGGIEIGGVIKDLSGGEIEGALVEVDGAYTTSDGDGRFSLWVRPGDAQVNAQAEGYSPGDARGAAPGHEFEVFLTPEAVLLGEVVSAEDGAPIEGATVMAGNMSGHVITDAQGAFRLTGLPPGGYRPRAIADDARGEAEVRTVLSVGETSAPITIRAHRAALVEGAIVADDGSLCAQGGVSLRDPATENTAYGAVEADGAVHLRGVLPGDYRVVVVCDGYAPREEYPNIAVAEAPLRELRWDVERGYAIRGEVVGPAGAALTTMRVAAARQAPPGEARARQLARQTFPQVDGRFAIEGLIPGDYEVRVMAWSPPQAIPAPLRVTVGEGDLEGVRIELPEVGALRGRVVDGDGQPVPSVRVQARAAAGSLAIHGHSSPEVSVADDGGFVLPSLAARNYRVSALRGYIPVDAAGGGSASADVEVNAGETTEVELVVAALDGVIRGQVVDADGSPVVDAFISAMAEPENAPGSPIRMARWNDHALAPKLSDQEGRFTLEALAPSKHTIIAKRRGGGEAFLEHVEVGSDVTLTIAATASLRGVVGFAGGGAPERFWMTATDDSVGFFHSETFVRTEGRFAFEALPAGTYKVDVRSATGDASAGVELAAGDAREDLRIELTPRVKVRGQVVDSDGAPVPGIRVSIRSGYGGTQSFMFDAGDGSDRRFVTDEAGRFELDRAPAGVVTVSLTPVSRGDSEFGLSAIPAVIDPETAVFELPPLTIARERLEDGQISGALGYGLKSWPADVEPIEDRLVVERVFAGGPATAAGIVPGDEIVSVDGQDVRPPNRHRYHTLTRVAPGTTLRIGLARGETVALTAAEPR